MRTLAALVITVGLGAGAGPATEEVAGDGGAVRVADPLTDRGRIAEAVDEAAALDSLRRK